MSVESNTLQSEEKPKITDKEFNFRAQEAKYEKQLAEIKAEKERYVQEIEELKQAKLSRQEEEEDSEPYVDNKRLEKKLAKFGMSTKNEIMQAMEETKRKAKEELKQEMWLENNPDFYDTMHKHAERFYEKAPHLAEAILQMPDTFERRKLVYHNIKSLGIDRPESKSSSIQEKIDANRRSPFYRPSDISSPPFDQAGDFSESGKKNAYENMLKLKANIRLG